ncbi:MAG: hypothetical protein AAF553_00330 [Pseudomonadota bacterium]
MISEIEAGLEAWKTTIDVQKHFNELSMKVRGLAVTVLAAFLAASGYSLESDFQIVFLDLSVSLTGLILLAAFVCWTAFYLMDRLWYHRLLAATVAHGRAIEAKLLPDVPTIGLTSGIDEASPILGLRARHRLSIFYGFFGALLFVGAGLAMTASWPFYLAGASIAFLILVLEVVSAKSNK